MRLVLDDIGADVVKTGMLHDETIVEAVRSELHATSPRPKLVVDPVMVAKGGASLLSAQAAASVLDRLLPLADLVTPNAPEASALAGIPVLQVHDLVRAGEILIEKGAQAALVKGGHLPSDDVVDALVTREGHRLFRSTRIETRHTHGTGCTLASAVAALLAQGVSLAEAVERAREFVRRAIEAAPGLGAGHGPLGHSRVKDG
jgi:hydroxymethylpyrimidine/phosphomethylpyrimidine kinase